MARKPRKKPYPAVRREPQKINARSWYYEERKGMFVVEEQHDDKGTYVRTVTILVPWRSVMEAALRHRVRQRSLA